MRKIFMQFFITLLLAFAFSGCSSSENGIFKYDIAQDVYNLDPQFSTNAVAQMVIANINEGLVTQDASGKINLAAAESFTISDDGLMYTFNLRPNIKWHDGTIITSKDFLYSFSRIFDPNAENPFAKDFISIENSKEVLAKHLSFDDIGIKTPNDNTIIFNLEQRNPFFLELLATTSAVPCSENFFQNSRGRYGLEKAYVNSNGPFLLSQWDNSKYLILRSNANYTSAFPAIAQGVNFYIGRENPTALFADGKSDIVNIPSEKIEDFEKFELHSFNKTIWCIVFNQNDAVLGNPLIRQGLTATVDHERLTPFISKDLTSTSIFIPPAIKLLDKSYREIVQTQSFSSYDPNRAKYLFSLGLKSMEIESFPHITLYVPQNGAHSNIVGQMQQDWQKYLNAYINIETLSATQIEEKLRSGNYQMLLMPFSPSDGSISSLFDVFTSDSSQNFFGYYNQRYDSIVDSALSEQTIEGVANKYLLAEKIILSDSVILPLYLQSTTYAVAKDVSGIDLSPFSGHIIFKYAKR